ncbi:hypothetical protein NDU88_004738 [Pleurodeles waltl]|uniref:DDE Tnp4 domain-containing protein n=1 Tax=Pleurodeles waltl TaxID=8319 RepID=A0AAV7MVS9_PLEWA|nr:hypothetical protein NDU88_004738 [Pleurodeles waltl]
MTPFGNPSTAAEQADNDAHKRTRSIVKRIFGILKLRFRCLDITGGSLLYSPEMVCRIILTCAILHNICVKRNIPLLEPDPYMPEDEEEEDAGLQQEGEQPNTAAGVRRRQQIHDQDPAIIRAAGQSSVLQSTPTQSTSAGTQTAAAPPIDSAAFQALDRKMDKFIRKVDKLSQDVAYIKKRVRSIRRTLRRANL